MDRAVLKLCYFIKSFVKKDDKDNMFWRFFLMTFFILNLTYGDELLESEVHSAVSLIDESQELDEVLNSRIICPPTFLESEAIEEIPACDPQVSINGTENPVNRSVIDLRQIIHDSPKCTGCSIGGGFTGPGFDDELQRKRINDARRYGPRDRTDWSTTNIIPPHYMTTLIPSYSLNYNVPEIGDELRKVHDQIRTPIENCNIRDEARYVSAVFLGQASEAASLGDYEVARGFLKIAKDLADFATSVSPGISEARDAYEFFTGKDAFTGEDLSSTSRTLAALGMIPILGGAIKGGKALVKLAKFAGEKFPKVYRASVNIAESAGRIYGNALSGKWANTFSEVNPADLMQGRVNKRLIDKLRSDKGIPTNWSLEKANDGKGIRFFRPNSNRADEIRIMPGNPQNPNPINQRPYVRIKKDGRYRDINGNVTDNPDLSHIPVDDFLRIPDIY